MPKQPNKPKPPKKPKQPKTGEGAAAKIARLFLGGK